MKNLNKNTISIGKSTGINHYNVRVILTRNDFFNRNILYKLEDNILTFKPTPAEYRGRSVRPRIMGKQYQFSIHGPDIPLGVFEIDEDSTEDELIVYFK